MQYSNDLPTPSTEIQPPRSAMLHFQRADELSGPHSQFIRSMLRFKYLFSVCSCWITRNWLEALMFYFIPHKNCTLLTNIVMSLKMSKIIPFVQLWSRDGNSVVPWAATITICANHPPMDTFLKMFGDISQQCTVIRLKWASVFQPSGLYLPFYCQHGRFRFKINVYITLVT